MRAAAAHRTGERHYPRACALARDKASRRPDACRRWKVQREGRRAAVYQEAVHVASPHVIGCRACQVLEAPGESEPRMNGRSEFRDRKCEAVALAVALPPNSSTKRTKRKRSRQPSEAARDEQEPPLKRAEVLTPMREDDDVQMSPEPELRPEQQEVIMCDVPGPRKRVDESRATHGQQEEYARSATQGQPVQQATDRARHAQPATHA